MERTIRMITHTHPPTQFNLLGRTLDLHHTPHTRLATKESPKALCFLQGRPEDGTLVVLNPDFEAADQTECKHNRIINNDRLLEQLRLRYSLRIIMWRKSFL
jgi:hypothetical protein